MRQMAHLPEPLEDFGEDGKYRAPVRNWMKEPHDRSLFL
jgi:hypothetical protein